MTSGSDAMAGGRRPGAAGTPPAGTDADRPLEPVSDLIVEDIPDRPKGGRLARIGGPVAFVVSMVAAGLVLWWQGALDDVGPAIRGANVAVVVAGLLLYLVGLALLCWRWHVLVRMTKGTSDLAKATEVFLISVSLNYVAPLKLAIPMRAAMTKKALGLDATETGSVVLWEIVADVAILALGTALWLLTTRDAYDDVIDAVGGQGVFIVVALVGGVVVVGAALAVAARKPALRAKVVDSFVRAMTYPRRRPADAIQAMVVTVVYWAVQAGVFWVLLVALDAEINAGLLLGLVTLPILFGMFSPGPGGAGVREALMIVVAGAAGVASAPVVVAAVAYRIALFAAIPILYVAARVWTGVRGGGAARME